MTHLFEWRKVLREVELAPTARNVAPSTQKAVAWALSSWMNPDGVAYPGVELIAKASVFTVRTVQKALAALVENGLLRVEKRGGYGPGETTVYVATIPEQRANVVPPRANVATKKGEPGSPEDVKEIVKEDGSELEPPYVGSSSVAATGNGDGPLCPACGEPVAWRITDGLICRSCDHRVPGVLPWR